MSINRQACYLVGVLFLISAFGGASAQETVYKWVDEDGVVHFGESPPAGVDAEVITTSAAPTVVPRETAPPPGPAASKAPTARANAPTPDNPPVEAPVPISELSLEELDARCETAREKLIAPLREAEINRCKAEPRTDPASCERVNADFGAAVRTVNGGFTPRMFHDIPPCLDAHNERNRRPR